MIQKRQVLINAIMSMIQTIVIGVVLFILYRFLLKTIGIKQLGIWSLVIATTSVSQIANFGLSGSVVKFVAKYVARGEDEKVSKIIQTAFLSITVFIGLALFISYPIIKWIIGLVILNESLGLALAILPYAFVAFWLLMLTSITQAGLDGYQRIDLRSIILMMGSLIHLVFCYLLAPVYGLMGIAYSTIIQNFLILINSWFLLRRCLPILPIIPYQWNKNLFKEIIGYGINVQMMTGITMVYDPITKAFLSKFGGLSMVGYYEMASKMILQFRGLIVSANQVLVPAIANLKESVPEKIKEIYLISYQLLFYLALPLFSLIIVCIPIISELWIGHYENVFVLFAILLAIGWFINTLNAPSYFANLGIGELRWNVISHFVIALLNVSLGVLLGILYDGVGVVIAWIISLAMGSSIISVSYHIRHRISLIELLPKASRTIILASLSGIFTTLLIYNKLDNSLNKIILNSIALLSFSIIIIFPLWYHPMRKRLTIWISNELLNIKIGVR